MTTTTSYTDNPITLSQFTVVLRAIGYNFHRVRDGFIIWKLEMTPDGRHPDGSWPALLTRRKPYCTAADINELVYSRNELADALMEVTGDGPFDVVIRIKAILNEDDQK